MRGIEDRIIPRNITSLTKTRLVSVDLKAACASIEEMFLGYPLYTDATRVPDANVEFDIIRQEEKKTDKGAVPCENRDDRWEKKRQIMQGKRYCRPQNREEIGQSIPRQQWTRAAAVHRENSGEERRDSLLHRGTEGVFVGRLKGTIC